MGHTRKTITTLLVLLLPAGAGVVTVHASPTCERFVRTYVTVPVRNKVSKATEIAWTKWRVAHPNWKPNPKVHRPKYLMSKKEQVEKVAFACQVTPDPLFLDAVFGPADLKPPPSEITPPSTEFPPVETADLVVPTELPPMLPPQPPFANAAFPPSTAPFLPPVFGSLPSPPPPSIVTTSQSSLPPLIAPVPEPSSLTLLVVGLMATGLMIRRRSLATSYSSH